MLNNNVHCVQVDPDIMQVQRDLILPVVKDPVNVSLSEAVPSVLLQLPCQLRPGRELRMLRYHGLDYSRRVYGGLGCC